MEEIPVPDKSGQVLVQHEICEQKINFSRPIDQYPPYATKADIEYLFRALNAEQVIDIFIALLLEKKVLLISKYKALLMHACVALISFLYPFSWKHVMIPILPKNMTEVLEAPVPYLIGVDPAILQGNSDDNQDPNMGSNLDSNSCPIDIPNEVYRVDLEMGFISLREAKPKLPSKEFKELKTRL